MSGRAARVIVTEAGDWTNRHQSVTQRHSRLYDVWNPAPPVTDVLGDLRLTASALQQILADAIADGVTLRAMGSGWSLSRAAVTDGRLINTAPLNWHFPIARSGVQASYTSDVRQLRYLQCGVSVAEVNTLLAQATPALALKTSGASNGQTIAGAVSTGTHGSAFRFGAMPDYVVGLQIITAPDRIVWLERATQPVLTDSLIARLGAIPVRDDAVFDSALVSFGSFGIVAGILIEAEPLYLLERERRRLPIDAGLRRALTTLDFSDVSTPHPSEEPYHFEAVVNPHDVDGGAFVTTMYKRPYRDDYPRSSGSGSAFGPGDDVLSLVGALGTTIPAVVAPLVNAVIGREYRPYAPRFGTPGETFGTTTRLQKTMSAELGVPLARAADTLDALLSVPAIRSYPGLLAFRFVKRSKALLAFTRFDTTCTIELPAASGGVTSSFYDGAWRALADAGIPYTLHWGQMNNFTPGRISEMYGADADTWRASRATLLSPDARAVFSSPFLASCGLA